MGDTIQVNYLIKVRIPNGELTPNVSVQVYGANGASGRFLFTGGAAAPGGQQNFSTTITCRDLGVLTAVDFHHSFYNWPVSLESISADQKSYRGTLRLNIAGETVFDLTDMNNQQGANYTGRPVPPQMPAMPQMAPMPAMPAMPAMPQMTVPQMAPIQPMAPIPPPTMPSGPPPGGPSGGASGTYQYASYNTGGGPAWGSAQYSSSSFSGGGNYGQRTYMSTDNQGNSIEIREEYLPDGTCNRVTRYRDGQEKRETVPPKQ